MESFWKNAIREILAEERVPMRSKDITRKIIENNHGLDLGNTPENTVNKYLRENKDLFKRISRGEYGLVEKSVTEDIDLDDMDWDSIDFGDTEVALKKTDKPNYKKASYFINSTIPSDSEKELLDLIVNFPLPLVKDEVCFAEILNDIEVEFSNEEKKRHQSIDKALLEKKLDELKKQIEEIERKAMQDHRFENLHGALLWRMRYAAERAQGLLDEVSGYTVEFQIEPLGEFIPGKGEEKPKVVIYNENIQKSIKDIVWIYASWLVMPAVFVHEMFHAWNYFKARRNSRSVLAIDEPMVEFETLYFLKKLYDYMVLQSHHLHKEVESVRKIYKDLVLNKQRSIGDVAAYGFGYYLFEKLNDDDSIKWIETYSEKSASIDACNEYVKKAEVALIPVYPFQSEKDVMELFEKIIFDSRAIAVTAEKSDASKTGSHVSLRDLVLACIETIGRKYFEAKELYAFAPIFKACMPHCPNLEEALKQELHELVNEHLLDTLPDDCYCVKLD